MALVRHAFEPGEAEFGVANIPQTNSVPVPSVGFDAGADEEMYFRFPAVNYGSGDLTILIQWYADTALSGVVRLGAAIAVITPEGDVLSRLIGGKLPPVLRHKVKNNQ